MPSTLNLKAFLFFFHSSMTILVSYLPVYFQVNGLGSGQIGMLLAIGPLAAMISQPFWGYITDKFRTSKKIIIFCLVSAIFSSLLMFLSVQYVLLLVTVFIFYSFMAPIGGLGDSLAQKTANQLCVSFGSIRMWGSIGFAVMSLLSGFLLAFIGVQYIYIPFLFFLLVTLFIAFRVRDVESSHKPVVLDDAIKLLKNKRFMWFLLIMMLVTITHRTNDSFLGIYIVERGGTEAFIGWAWFIGVMSEALIFATSAIWFRRFNVITFIILSAILFSIRWFLMGIIENPFYVLPLQIFHGLTFGMFYLCAFHYITKIVPEEVQATSHLLFYSLFFGLSGVLGSSIGGQIIDQINAAFLYKVLGFTALLGAVVFMIYQYYYGNDKKSSNVL